MAAGLSLVRMFGITAFYHRHFSHRSYKAGRFWQFLFAVLGNSSAQRGPLWWSAHHRHHLCYADQEEDVHSPVRQGLWWSHMICLTTQGNFPTRKKYMQDWQKVPELVWINRFDTVVPLLLALSLYGMGEWLASLAPDLGTNGPQMLIWGFFLSTVVLFHGTCTINSLDHMIGTRRCETTDTGKWGQVLTLDKARCGPWERA